MRRFALSQVRASVRRVKGVKRCICSIEHNEQLAVCIYHAALAGPVPEWRSFRLFRGFPVDKSCCVEYTVVEAVLQATIGEADPDLGLQVLSL